MPKHNLIRGPSNWYEDGVHHPERPRRKRGAVNYNGKNDYMREYMRRRRQKLKAQAAVTDQSP